MKRILFCFALLNLLIIEGCFAQGKPSMTGGTTPSSTPAPATPASTSGTKPGMNVGDVLGGVIGTVTGNSTGGNGGVNFTQSEAADAIKEALLKGITNGVKTVSATDGYLGNSFIKIPFPQDAQVIASTLQMVGAGSLIDKLVLQINRSAEQAAKDAMPIFVNSIKQMTLTDAINIVSNQQTDAATRFLQRTTTDQLVASFRPKIKNVLDKTRTTTLWSQIMTTYNRVPFVQKINPDLTDFVTRKALDGLFYMVAQEEAKIRKDPLARTSDILTKVFGGLKR